MNLSTPLARLRWIAFIEGWSFLLLLGVGMPLKYIAGIPQPNFIIGSAHGFLFVVYAASVFEMLLRWRWSSRAEAVWFAVVGAVASLVPGGTFAWDRSLRKMVPPHDNEVTNSSQQSAIVNH